MEYTRAVIEISSDEDEASDITAPEETRGQPGANKMGKAGDGNDLLAGASLNVSDDDECVILDGVPQSATIGAEYTELGSEVLDEMLIVGEKGQFACRDYPHPRYLCATFLFSMTPHKKHCAMCHCYVCDCLAPCRYWESHCSSTHKDRAWRVERLLFRRRKREQQLAHKLVDVKPALPCPSQPALKSVPSQLPRSNDLKSANRHGPIHYKRPDQPISKYAQPVLSTNDEPEPAHQPDPMPDTRKTTYGEPPHLSTGTVAPRPKDILCELYKICPAVISCRRRIPPSLSPHELSETDQDD